MLVVPNALSLRLYSNEKYIINHDVERVYGYYNAEFMSWMECFHNSRHSVSIKYIHIFDTKSPSSVNVIRIYLEARTFLFGVHYSSFTFNQRNGHLVL